MESSSLEIPPVSSSGLIESNGRCVERGRGARCRCIYVGTLIAGGRLMGT